MKSKIGVFLFTLLAVLLAQTASGSSDTLDELYQKLQKEKQLLLETRNERKRNEKLEELRNEIRQLEQHIQKTKDHIVFEHEGQLEWIDKKSFKEILAVVAVQSKSPETSRLVVEIARLVGKFNRQKLLEWDAQRIVLEERLAKLAQPIDHRIEQIQLRIREIEKAIKHLENVTAYIEIESSKINPDNKFKYPLQEKEETVVKEGDLAAGNYLEVEYELAKTYAKAKQKYCRKSCKTIDYQVNFEFTFDEPEMGKVQSKKIKIIDREGIVTEKEKQILEMTIEGSAELKKDGNRFLWVTSVQYYSSPTISFYEEVKPGIFGKAKLAAVSVGWIGHEFIKDGKKTFVVALPTILDKQSITAQLNSPRGGRIVTWTFKKNDRQ